MGTQIPPTERGTAATTFRPMSAEAKRSPISATAELSFTLPLLLLLLLQLAHGILYTQSVISSFSHLPLAASVVFSKYLLVSLRQELDAASLRGLPFPKPHTAEQPGAGSLTPFSVSSLACNEFVTGILVNKETMSFET